VPPLYPMDTTDPRAVLERIALVADRLLVSDKRLREDGECPLSADARRQLRRIEGWCLECLEAAKQSPFPRMRVISNGETIYQVPYTGKPVRPIVRVDGVEQPSCTAFFSAESVAIHFNHAPKQGAMVEIAFQPGEDDNQKSAP
jgi:hypothetical protein